MTNQEYRAASKRYRNVTMSMGGSGEDYISGRCLVQNGFLIPGLILQVIGVEKMLKAITACQNEEGKIIHSRHDLQLLFNEVVQNPGYDIGRFGYYIPKLEEIYKMRYHDAKRASNSFSYGGSYDNGVIDDLYCELVDMIDLIPEFKWRCGLPAIVFDPYDRQHKKWAIQCNPYLVKKMKKWKPLSEIYFTNELKLTS